MGMRIGDTSAVTGGKKDHKLKIIIHIFIHTHTHTNNNNRAGESSLPLKKNETKAYKEICKLLAESNLQVASRNFWRLKLFF